MLLSAFLFLHPAIAAEAWSTPVPGDSGAGLSIAPSEGSEASSGGAMDRLARFAGRTHPALTHFPVAWILAAAGLEWAALFSARRPRRARRPSPLEERKGPALSRKLGAASFILLVLAAAAGAAAAGTGWLLSLDREPEAALIRHGRWAYATVILGWLALASRLLALKRGSRAWRFASALLLAGAAVSVGIAGHLGGSLVFGEGYPWSAEEGP